jgi:hypothetical protein
VLGDDGVQPANSLEPVWNSSLGEHLPLFVDHANVVVGFSPIDSYKDHWHLLGGTRGLTEPKESSDELIEQCSWHNIPPVVHLSSPAGGGTV